MKKRWLLVVPLVLAAAGLLAWRFLRPVPVQVERISRGTAIDAVYASGTVEAADRVEVKARVPGPVRELLVREGDRVTRDQLIARIEAPSLGYDVDRGEAELTAARARASSAPQVAALRATERALVAQKSQAEADLARLTRLAQSGAVASQDLERARTQLASIEGQLAANRAQQRDLRIGLRAAVSSARASVASLEARASDAEIRSPMDGVVLARRVEPGEVVGLNQNLVRIGDVSRLRIEAEVDEADVGRVRVGMPALVRIYAFEDRVFRGRVADILPEADRARKAFEVHVLLDEAVEGLRPGMTAEINIVTRRREGVLLAPSDAVRDGTVWLVRDGARVEQRRVRVGIRDVATVEIERGLREGDPIVVGDVTLAPNARVTATERARTDPSRPRADGR